MTTRLTTGGRNAAANAIADLLDAGTTDANGDLVIRTAADAEVATLALSNPAFGNAVNGVATAAAIGSDTNATGGTADNFILQNRDNAEVIGGDVGLSGAELNVSSLAIGAGDTVSVSSMTITVPATS